MRNLILWVIFMLTTPHNDRDALCVLNGRWADSSAHCLRCDR